MYNHLQQKQDKSIDTSTGDYVVKVKEIYQEHDPISGALVQTDIIHNEIHKGDYYRVLNRTTASLGQYARMVVRTSTEVHPHIISKMSSKKGCEVFLYKNAIATGGTTLTAQNANQGSTNVCETVFVSNPTITTTGTQIDADLIGSSDVNPVNPGIGGGLAHNYEWLLDIGTTYELRALSLGNNNVVYIKNGFYEEP